MNVFGIIIIVVVRAIMHMNTGLRHIESNISLLGAMVKPKRVSMPSVVPRFFCADCGAKGWFHMTVGSGSMYSPTMGTVHHQSNRYDCCQEQDGDQIKSSIALCYYRFLLSISMEFRGNNLRNFALSHPLG